MSAKNTFALCLVASLLSACGGQGATRSTPTVAPECPEESKVSEHAEPPAVARREIAPAANGLRLPADYREWPVIAVSRRNDKNSLRAIIGNDVAIEAARQGTTQPWPDGSILAKIVWKDGPLESWEPALVPKELVHVEIMVKDQSRFAEHGGWGFARWVGHELRPHSEDPTAGQACFACHEPVAESDYVFTRPSLLP